MFPRFLIAVATGAALAAEELKAPTGVPIPEATQTAKPVHAPAELQEVADICPPRCQAALAAELQEIQKAAELEEMLQKAGGKPKNNTLFGSAFASTRSLVPKPKGKHLCSPRIARFNPLTDPKLSKAAKRALLKGTLLVNDKSKGSGWLVQLGVRKTLRYDLPFNGGNHESGVSPDGKHFVIPHYETPFYNSTEGGGSPGSQASIIDVHTGRSAVLPMEPNPWVTDADGNPVKDIVYPKPHDANYLPNGDVLLTGQVANSIWKVDSVTGDVTKYELAQTGCSTPHLVRVIPSKGDNADGRPEGKARFAVTGCRGSNAGTPSDYVGRLAVIDLETGKARAFETPDGKWNEGITVTATGDIWVGSLNEHLVTVFGWEDGVTRTLDNLKTLKSFQLKFPLRFAYEEVTDRVAIATINQPGVARGDTSDSGLHVFDAKSRKLVKSMQLKTERGVINSEGLRNGPGFFYTGGYDTQALVVVDASSLEQVAEIMLPRCTLPAGFCDSKRTAMPNAATNGPSATDKAKAAGLTGWNNWSGGVCEATERSPFDRRFAVLDGFNYSPVFPAWAWL